VFDSRDRDIFAVNTRGQDQLELHRTGDHVVTTAFATNILPPGQYSISIAAWQSLGGVVQLLDRCFMISVDSVPFYPDHRYEVSGSSAASIRAVWHQGHSTSTVWSDS
jgi:hypothetical protein